MAGWAAWFAIHGRSCFIGTRGRTRWRPRSLVRAGVPPRMAWVVARGTGFAFRERGDDFNAGVGRDAIVKSSQIFQIDEVM
jgi:hypothetical protein